MENKERLFSLFEQFTLESEASRSKVTSLNDRILIVDFMNLFIRSFSASPAMNDNGEHVGGLVASLYSLGSAIRQINATRCIVVCDGEGGSQRKRKLYPEYKAKRKVTQNLNRTYDFKNEEEEKRSMMFQLQRLGDYMRNLPIHFIAISNVEADDVIAYIAKEIYTDPSNTITIMSSDKDFLQLVDDRISVWSPTKKKMYTPADVLAEYDINSQNFLMYRMLFGDTSDNIPGIDGCGKKTIPKFLPMLREEKKCTLSEILQHAEEKNSGKKKLKIYESILTNKERLLLNESLMQLESPDISGHAKSKVIEILNSGIPALNNYEIQLMYIHDKISGAMRNITEWLTTTFSLLNSFANNGDHRMSLKDLAGKNGRE